MFLYFSLTPRSNSTGKNNNNQCMSKINKNMEADDSMGTIPHVFMEKIGKKNASVWTEKKN